MTLWKKKYILFHCVVEQLVNCHVGLLKIVHVPQTISWGVIQFNPIKRIEILPLPVYTIFDADMQKCGNRASQTVLNFLGPVLIFSRFSANLFI